jgi:acyl-CoA thioesterase
VRSWREIDPVSPSIPGLPQFTRHLEFRPVAGIPYTGADDALVTGWIRMREPTPNDDALVVALVDAWWPAELPRMSAPRHVVTLSSTIEVFGGAAVLGDAPLLHSSRTIATRDGYITEERELWTDDGQLVALNQQTLAIVK